MVKVVGEVGVLVVVRELVFGWMTHSFWAS